MFGFKCESWVDPNISGEWKETVVDLKEEGLVAIIKAGAPVGSISAITFFVTWKDEQGVDQTFKYTFSD